MECFAADEQVDWQYECITVLFGWVRVSQRWQRQIRRFREGFIMVAKKNKKTPTIGGVCCSSNAATASKAKRSSSSARTASRSARI